MEIGNPKGTHFLLFELFMLDSIFNGTPDQNMFLLQENFAT